MEIRRDIVERLKEWKNQESKKPILLKGARQIGKTWVMETFGRECFDYCAKFDFDRQEELKSVFRQTKSPERIIKELALYTDVPIIAEIRRDIVERLKEWKNQESKKPILLKGARQIGKTWVMETFGRECFDYCAKFDFDRQEEL